MIGVFTSTKRCQVVYDTTIDQSVWRENKTIFLSGTIVVDLPYSFLTGKNPLPQISIRQPQKKLTNFQYPVPGNETEWVELVQSALAHYNICDQSAAAHQFDQTVQGTTVQTYVSGPGARMPDELFVKAPLFGKPYGQGHANAVNQWYGDIDPATFGRLMLASAATKLVAAGFAPSDMTYCANVYSPPVTEDPEHAWRLDQLVRSGYAPGTVEIGIPVISGKDSSSGRFKNETTGEKIDAPLTLDVLAVGRMPDVRKLIAKPFQKAGDLIVLYSPGLIRAHLGGSILYDLAGERGDRLPQINLKNLRKGLEAYHRATNYMRSRSAIAEGGLIRRLFECCYGSGLGCVINLPRLYDPLTWLFSELHGSILFTASDVAWSSYIGSSFQIIGCVVKDPTITVDHLFSADISELGKGWSKTFTEVIS